MTYNVHSCKGRDGRILPERIAEVLDAYKPDVAGLQEVRMGRISPEAVDHPEKVRVGTVEPPVGQSPLPPLASIPRLRVGVDQPGRIARMIGMKPLFYPLIRSGEEDYGIALLARQPARLVRAANLPTLPERPLLERRGAIWAEIQFPRGVVNVVNTHLGLNREERLAQVGALLGSEWSIHPESRVPLIVCGDLNAWPLQSAYRRLRSRFQDVQRIGARRPLPTWPSNFPLLRIDHILVGCPVRVLSVEVPRTPLTRVASDHLPVIADLEFEDGFDAS
ncbi:MAG: endonuclease/exonuclease/phosphatase family protein [Elusimicrobia bacterium]|nr:endonuclease/exonuclease/phosphatase family protein [Elusimicrobiota bacterium]